jgi:hypothetical protein
MAMLCSDSAERRSRQGQPLASLPDGTVGRRRGLARVLRPVATRFHGTLELPPYMRNHAEECVAITSSAALIVQ